MPATESALVAAEAVTDVDIDNGKDNTRRRVYNNPPRLLRTTPFPGNPVASIILTPAQMVPGLLLFLQQKTRQLDSSTPSGKEVLVLSKPWLVDDPVALGNLPSS